MKRVVAYFHTRHLRDNTAKLKAVTTGLEGVTQNLEGVTKVTSSLTSGLGVITKENAAMGEELMKVATALPTRDIGEFPEYVDKLADMIRGAKHNIIVVCDVPCYCYFSDRKLWVKYWAALLVLLCYKKGAPQKGQPGSCRSRTLAMVCRRVAIDQGLCRSTRTGRTPRTEVVWPFGNG
jgi:hypothetical protein